MKNIEKKLDDTNTSTETQKKLKAIKQEFEKKHPKKNLENQARKAREQEAKRLAAEKIKKAKAEAERARKEAEAKRLAAETEAERARNEAEAKRLAAKKAEAEAKRLAEEAEAAKKAAAEAKRLAEEAEAKRLAEEAEAKRLAEEAVAKRLAEEAEAKRLAEEAEAKRLAEEAERKTAEEARIAAEEAEQKAQPNTNKNQKKPINIEQQLTEIQEKQDKLREMTTKANENQFSSNLEFLNQQFSQLSNLQDIRTDLKHFNLGRKTAFLEQFETEIKKKMANQIEEINKEDLLQQIKEFNKKLSMQKSLNEEYEKINGDTKTSSDQLQNLASEVTNFNKKKEKLLKLNDSAITLLGRIKSGLTTLKGAKSPTKTLLNTTMKAINTNKDLYEENRNEWDNKATELEDLEKQINEKIENLEKDFDELKTKRREYLTKIADLPSSINEDKKRIDDEFNLIKDIPTEPQKELAGIESAIEVLKTKLKAEDLTTDNLKNLFKSDKGENDPADAGDKLTDIKKNFVENLREYFKTLIETKTEKTNKELKVLENKKESKNHQTQLNFYLDDTSIEDYIKKKNESMKLEKILNNKISNLKTIEKEFIHTHLWDDFYDVIEKYKETPQENGNEINKENIEDEINKFLSTTDFATYNIDKAQKLAIKNDSPQNVFDAISLRRKTLLEEKNTSITQCYKLFLSVLPEKLYNKSDQELLELYKIIFKRFGNEERDNFSSVNVKTYIIRSPDVKITTKKDKNSMYEALVSGIFTGDDLKKDTFINTLRLRAILFNFSKKKKNQKPNENNNENKAIDNSILETLHLTDLSKKIEGYFNEEYNFNGTINETLQILYGEGIPEMFNNKKIEFIDDTNDRNDKFVSLLKEEKKEKVYYSYYTTKDKWDEKTKDLKTKILFRPTLNYSLPPNLKTYRLQK